MIVSRSSREWQNRAVSGSLSFRGMLVVDVGASCMTPVRRSTGVMHDAPTPVSPARIESLVFSMQTGRPRPSRSPCLLACSLFVERAALLVVETKSDDTTDIWCAEAGSHIIVWSSGVIAVIVLRLIDTGDVMEGTAIGVGRIEQLVEAVSSVAKTLIVSTVPECNHA